MQTALIYLFFLLKYCYIFSRAYLPITRKLLYEATDGKWKSTIQQGKGMIKYELKT
jgi:hypothetical protein